MERVTYAGEQFLTGSDIAHALLDYAAALAAATAAATVAIPTIDLSGRAGTSHVLIGPASQLVLTRIETGLADPTDAELVAQLRRKADELHGRQPAAMPYVDEVAAEDQYYADYGL